MLFSQKYFKSHSRRGAEGGGEGELVVVSITYVPGFHAGVWLLGTEAVFCLLLTDMVAYTTWEPECLKSFKERICFPYISFPFPYLVQLGPTGEFYFL